MDFSFPIRFSGPLLPRYTHKDGPDLVLKLFPKRSSCPFEVFTIDAEPVVQETLAPLITPDLTVCAREKPPKTMIN